MVARNILLRQSELPIYQTFSVPVNWNRQRSMMAKERLHQRDGDGRGNPNTRTCFYKIMLPTNSIHLRIPPAFRKQLLNDQTERATLRSPCGIWDVKLLQENGDIYFAEGWQDFVRHHSLGSAEFLLFNYNGKMSFDVAIFGKNGCARNYESAAKSGQESASSFTSTLPFFRHSIKGCNLGSRSTLLIPKAFSRIHLRPSRQIMILQNAEGISWRASILVTSGKHLSITGGWKAFSDDNLIKKGDVCIFELVEQNTMQVHIFR